MTAPIAYPLAWPLDLPRSTKRARSPFRVSLNRAVSDLQDALRLFGNDSGLPVVNVVISSNVTLGAAKPSDPGVAVYFDWDGAQRCIAVDRFPEVEANVRAIYQILEGRRQELRYGGLHIVRATFRGFAALPPPPEDRPSPQRSWRAVYGWPEGTAPSRADVENVYRALARQRHPDAPGGSHEAMAELNAAREAALAELTAA
ncbi:MAG TPA: hypothetical protein PKA33_20745 [Amaricoccus sp.]|uniref:hypothetical protein n=1 Tax=Amaricoccus sp. TaxID=1872485 RepID=UPI002BEA1698|nr:hypothetical protein [Amaricoccus sp.]HMQ94625.1 hypothetical protein [Amaricoccus sp.]HMR54746.1 hypothetical protein [Amaricoccus sp.]HMR61691.1 hypothetical protein [Amaricoccus sp.]HMU01758.1 hypothetical protein [Amaricoccus sp.]